MARRTHTFQANLKWTLWTTDENFWQERALGAMPTARSCFEQGGEETVIYTSPSKEIRYGVVTIREGEAYVDFKAVWDEPSELASLFLPCDTPGAVWNKTADRIAAWLSEHEGFLDGNPEDPIGARVQRTLKAETFEELMAAIDACEEELITASDAAWRDLKSAFSERSDAL